MIKESRGKLEKASRSFAGECSLSLSLPSPGQRFAHSMASVQYAVHCTTTGLFINSGNSRQHLSSPLSFFLSEDLLLFSFTLWLPMVHTFGPQDLPSPIPYTGSFFSLLIFPLEPFAEVFLGTLQTSFQEPFLLFSHSIVFLVAVAESSSTPLLKDIEQDAPDHYISPRRNVRLTPLPQLTHLAYSVPESFNSASPYLAFGARTRRVLKTGFEYGALPGGLNCRSYYLLDPSRLTLEQAHPRPTFRTHSRLIRLHCRHTETNGLFIRLLCQGKTTKERKIEKGSRKGRIKDVDGECSFLGGVVGRCCCWGFSDDDDGPLRSRLDFSFFFSLPFTLNLSPGLLGIFSFYYFASSYPFFFGLVSSLTAFFFSTGMCEERIA